MPRRKKLPAVPDITGMGTHPEKMIVQKTNPLLSLSETGLTLADFKILDTYLARINSHDPDKRFVRLQKGEIEKLLGVTKINQPDLEKRLKNLFQTVTIRDEHKQKGFTLISLFEKAECYKDEDGLWQIDLGASYSAMAYIFTPENLGYLRYRLSNIINLTSRYSYILFLYLEQNRHMHLSWETDLDELKTLLRCTASSYTGFKEFNDKILKKSFNELNEKTTCHFSYAPVKRGRTVKAVRFILEPLAVMEDEKIPEKSETLSPLDESAEERDKICFGFSAPEFKDFTNEQLQVLRELGWSKKNEKDVERHLHLLGDMSLACQYATSDYLRKVIITAGARRPNNLFAYVKKTVENDV